MMICAALMAFLLASPAAAREIGADALDALPQVDIVLLGEVHDNPLHHANQARAVAAIAPAALVFEMLLPEQVKRLPKDMADAARVDAAIGWTERGWPDFALYRPIFAAAPKARVYGADVPQRDVRRAAMDGAAAVMAGFGLDKALPEGVQDQRETELWAAHCFAMPKGAMAGMVQVQRLRDAALARAAIRALRETGGPVAVILGAEHARTDWGVPALIRAEAPALTVLSVGQVEGSDGPQDGPQPFDLWIATDGVAGRDDPCAAFGATAG
ncbi:ChaN family lipoprotein [Paragemmobacter straminiformis]|uniref:ChaN family lipoprotein n=1 Tax=Paragemmobacter straminiformis TaxID=2045119 RepID=A0A842IAK6_9RHOB|nr:ChaN family lipoprotein [Gemmobacter straminiformis]MBC2836377.1 ChaN family lipoprotein [Gemmobacter straminiformis]